MLEKNMKNVDAVVQREAFRQKVNHYNVCMIDNCPLHEQCLRWLVGQYVESLLPMCTSVNPRYPKVGTEQCEMFRKNQRVVMKRGLRNLYHDMPARIEKGVRWQLIAMWGRKKYYEVRKGDCLITADMQEDITDACRHHGWQGPIVYDGEDVDWDW